MVLLNFTRPQVGALDKSQGGLPVFVVMCSNAVHKFVCQDEDDMDDWIRVLTPNSGIKGGDGSDDDITCQGFLKKVRCAALRCANARIRAGGDAL